MSGKSGATDDCSCAFSVVVSMATGLFVVSLFLPAQLSSHRLLKVSIASGVGLGISSCVFFGWLLAAGKTSRGVAIADVTLLAILFGFVVVLYPQRRNNLKLAGAGPDRKTWPALYTGALGTFVVCLATALIAQVKVFAAYPNGGWDAWAIWQLHARFLFRGEELWRDGFAAAIDWSHPDYPLLIPALTARSWSYLGSESALPSALIAMVFTFATVGVLFATLDMLRGRIPALLASSTVVATPAFMWQGSQKTGDIPLAFFITACVGLVCLKDSIEQGRSSMQFLIGLCAGLAAWTKNEGWSFALCLAVAHLVSMGARSNWRREARDFLWLLCGLALIGAIVLTFKMEVAPPNYMFREDQASVWSRLITFSRYWPIAKAFARESLAFGLWKVNLVIVLMVYALLAGCKLTEATRRGFVIGATALVLTLASYFAAYVITPVDVQWQLSASLGRLLLHLWPGAVLLFFLATKPLPLRSGSQT